MLGSYCGSDTALPQQRRQGQLTGLCWGLAAALKSPSMDWSTTDGLEAEDCYSQVLVESDLQRSTASAGEKTAVGFG